MMNVFSAIAVILSGLACATSWQHPSLTRGDGGGNGGSPVVHVKNGTIAGLHSSTYNQDLFLGIPFAQPPLGELRFRNPQSRDTKYPGVLQATEYAPECIGYGGDQIGYPISEDCLYLNVIRPAGYEHENLPVGVWIYGGGLIEGGTRDERYNLSFIVENSVQIGKPIMAASIAYRLSAWGFLQSQEVSASGNTNMGFRDQRLALHWIQENIQAFGGDPDKVTIWGESAGAFSVGTHLVAYNGRDDKLFRAGIMESGNPINYYSYRTAEIFQPQYDGIVNASGCAGTKDSLKCLRHVPYHTLNAAINTSYVNDWQPIVDGDFIQHWGSEQLAKGNFVKVPIIDGANTDEGTAFSPAPVDNTTQFADYATNSSQPAFLASHLAPELVEAYSNTPDYWIPPVVEVGNYSYASTLGAQYRRSCGYWGDVVMIANRRGTCEAWARHRLHAYCYRFNTRPAGIPTTVGVTHFMDVAFVFDNTQGLGYGPERHTTDPFEGEPQSYFQLAKLMSSSWASFIHDLDPNSFRSRYPSAEQWPKYRLDKPENIVWDANSTKLAYTEPDTFRKEGIRWILDHAADYHR